MVFRKEIELDGRTLTIEVGKVAKQADGAAWVQYGETIVLATVVSNRERGENTDFFPLTVDFRERKYAGGKFPGGFFKREGRPHDKDVLIARLIDRQLRPLFPKGYFHETQIMVSVISYDEENEAGILGAIGASTALRISNIPFDTSVAAVSIGRIDGKLVLNPRIKEIEDTDLFLVVAGSKDAIMMVEGEAKEVGEEVFLEALDFAHEQIKKIVEIQEEIVAAVGKPTREWEPLVVTEEIETTVREAAAQKVEELINISDKVERRTAQRELAKTLIEEFAERFPEQEKLIKWALEELVKESMRAKILKTKVRLDGRDTKEIRPISIETGILPRAHGSALFTRGQTQSMGTLTLGSKINEQKIDNLEGEYWKTFSLHYNFPPFCVGEVRRFLAPGRRELGHGNLAERSLKPMLPPWEKFPYTVRIVSEVLESNGSSSMASVCSGSLALMDGGVPVSGAVAGIAMGLIKQDDQYVILSDILGDEDHLGDMDFKVAGSSKGINAFQMDIKISGLPKEIMAEALVQAREGREHILGLMTQSLPQPREQLSKYAPCIVFMTIEPDMIGTVIGPGGKMIRKLQSDYEVNIEIDDDGTVCISAENDQNVESVMKLIKQMTTEPEIGEVFDAKVVKITDFGAFVEILPGREGLVHVSELEWRRVDKVTDVLNLGDKVQVKLVKITPEGKLDLSRKELLPKPEGYKPPPPRSRGPRPPHRGGGKPPHRGGGQGR